MVKFVLGEDNFGNLFMKRGSTRSCFNENEKLAQQSDVLDVILCKFIWFNLREKEARDN